MKSASIPLKVGKDIIQAIVGRNGHAMLVDALGEIAGQIKARDVRAALEKLAKAALRK
jgi:hypothetical protein